MVDLLFLLSNSIRAIRSNAEIDIDFKKRVVPKEKKRKETTRTTLVRSNGLHMLRVSIFGPLVRTY